jgi:hypothetical protein
MERRRITYELVPGNEVAHIARGVLINLLVVAEDEDGDVYRAQDGELMSLLEQATFALEEGPRAIGVSDGAAAEGAWRCYLHGAVAVILDGLDLNLPATHCDVCDATVVEVLYLWRREGGLSLRLGSNRAASNERRGGRGTGCARRWCWSKTGAR